MTEPRVHNGESAAPLAPNWLDPLRSRSPGVWQNFVNLYAPLVYHWCRESGLSDTEAAEAGQRVFRAVYATLADIPGGGSETFRDWVRVVTRKTIRDFGQPRNQIPGGGSEVSTAAFQHWLANPPGASDISAIETKTDAAEQQTSENPAARDPVEDGILLKRAMELVLAQTPEKTKLAFLRLTVDRHDPAEVARELGLSVGEVYLAKSRVMRLLRDEYAELISLDRLEAPR